MIPIRQHSKPTEERESLNFEKLVRGLDVIKDAVLEVNKFKRVRMQKYVNKSEIISAIETEDVKFLRGLSNYYFSTSGIYARFVKYLAGLPTYDWYAYPYMFERGGSKEKVQKDLGEVIRYLDNMLIPTTFYDITTKVILNGCFYGYLVNNSAKTLGTILELPVDYCRSRYRYNGMDAVEFNVKYFDEQIGSAENRKIVLESFPDEFLKNYLD